MRVGLPRFLFFYIWIVFYVSLVCLGWWAEGKGYKTQLINKIERITE